MTGQRSARLDVLLFLSDAVGTLPPGQAGGQVGAPKLLGEQRGAVQTGDPVREEGAQSAEKLPPGYPHVLHGAAHKADPTCQTDVLGLASDNVTGGSGTGREARHRRRLRPRL